MLILKNAFSFLSVFVARGVVAGLTSLCALIGMTPPVEDLTTVGNVAALIVVTGLSFLAESGIRRVFGQTTVTVPSDTPPELISAVKAGEIPAPYVIPDSVR